MVRAVVGVVLGGLVLVASGCKLTSGPIEAQDGAPADGPITSGDAAPDAPIDGVSDVGCSGLDGDVVMYLTMNRPNVTIWPDLTGEHDGRTSPGTTGGVDGPNLECGRAYDARDNVRLVIDDSAEFDLATGSLDVYAQVPVAGVERGIVSRDALGDGDGHFEIGFSTTNQVIVRIQSAAAEAYRCSAAQLTAGEWVQIGVNFGAGGLELFVDGVAANEAQATYAGALQTCGAAFDGGIAGNDNPWVVGFSSAESVDGTPLPVSRSLATAVDELRLSRVRRAYAAP